MADGLSLTRLQPCTRKQLAPKLISKMRQGIGLAGFGPWGSDFVLFYYSKKWNVKDPEDSYSDFLKAVGGPWSSDYIFWGPGRALV